MNYSRTIDFWTLRPVLHEGHVFYAMIVKINDFVMHSPIDASNYFVSH